MTVPPLSELLRWLADTPAAFRGDAHLAAVVSDLLETLTGTPADAALLAAFRSPEPKRQRWVLAGARLLWHPAFLGADRAGLLRFLVQDLAALAAVAPADGSVDDEERREELIRLALRALGRRLPGESANEGDDRLRQVDSVERRHVLNAAAGHERRAREVREAMARKAAEEAAAKVARE